jgi:serine/threonine protein kinase
MMRGTRGYLAPEWLSNAPITDRTDVYSFDTVLLKLVSRRKNCSDGGGCKISKPISYR